MCVCLANSIESEMVEKSSAKVLDELKFTGAPHSEYSGAMNINNGSGGRVLKGEGEKSSAFLSTGDLANGPPMEETRGTAVGRVKSGQIWTSSNLFIAGLSLSPDNSSLMQQIKSTGKGEICTFLQCYLLLFLLTAACEPYRIHLLPFDPT